MTPQQATHRIDQVVGEAHTLVNAIRSHAARIQSLLAAGEPDQAATRAGQLRDIADDLVWACFEAKQAQAVRDRGDVS